jgi:hypothetical protein
MNYQEEQSLEMEALAAIFGDQFNQISPTSCSILATPNADQVHISCSLEWSMPSKYPEIAPDIIVRTKMGMDDVWCQQLKDKLLSNANDLVGGPMIFTLVEAARDWLTERNVAGVGEGSMHAKMLAKELEKAKAVEQQQQQQQLQQQQQQGKTKENERSGRVAKIDGTAVTLETFTKWMQGLIKEELTAKNAAESASKVTGRQLFEKGNVKIEEEEVVQGDVEDFDRNLILEEDVDLDMLEDDDDALEDEEEEEGVLAKS